MTEVDVLRRLSTWHLHGAQKVSNEEGRVDLPSSIDVRLIEQRRRTHMLRWHNASRLIAMIFLRMSDIWLVLFIHRIRDLVIRGPPALCIFMSTKTVANHTSIITSQHMLRSH